MCPPLPPVRDGEPKQTIALFIGRVGYTISSNAVVLGGEGELLFGCNKRGGHRQLLASGRTRSPLGAIVQNWTYIPIVQVPTYMGSECEFSGVGGLVDIHVCTPPSNTHVQYHRLSPTKHNLIDYDTQ